MACDRTLHATIWATLVLPFFRVFLPKSNFWWTPRISLQFLPKVLKMKSEKFWRENCLFPFQILGPVTKIVDPRGFSSCCYFCRSRTDKSGKRHHQSWYFQHEQFDIGYLFFKRLCHLSFSVLSGDLDFTCLECSVTVRWHAVLEKSLNILFDCHYASITTCTGNGQKIKPSCANRRFHHYRSPPLCKTVFVCVFWLVVCFLFVLFFCCCCFVLCV